MQGKVTQMTEIRENDAILPDGKEMIEIVLIILDHGDSRTFITDENDYTFSNLDFVFCSRDESALPMKVGRR